MLLLSSLRWGRQGEEFVKAPKNREEKKRGGIASSVSSYAADDVLLLYNNTVCMLLRNTNKRKQANKRRYDGPVTTTTRGSIGPVRQIHRVDDGVYLYRSNTYYSSSSGVAFFAVGASFANERGRPTIHHPPHHQHAVTDRLMVVEQFSLWILRTKPRQ